METYRKDMDVAGIRIAVESERPFCFTERCTAFECLPGEPDVTFFLKWDTQPPTAGEVLYDSSKYQILQKDGRRYRICRWDTDRKKIEWYLCQTSREPVCYEVGICQYNRGEVYAFNPLHCTDLAAFLIQFDAAVLHSSLIRFRDKAIVFSAPSQTGKSTQAAIWEKCYGAEIINGDRSVIRRYQSHWIAAGSPYAGSSRIYKNEAAELAAIVVLRQGKKNTIRKLETKEAYLCLLSELMPSMVNREAVDLQSRWLLELLKQVPVYMLSCLPNPAAADLLYRTLEDRNHGTK